VEAVIDMKPYLATIIEPTVTDVHHRWGEYVDYDDLLQEAAVWWYGPGQPYLEGYLAEDENHVRLRRSIWRFVARLAEREKAQARGYEPCDQVNYHAREIIAVLGVALDPDGTPSSGGADYSGMPTAKRDPAEGGDSMAVLVDVRRALSQLTEDDLHFLTLCQDLHLDWERIAQHTDILADSARRRHLRIAERMARWLNKTEEKNAA